MNIVLWIVDSQNGVIIRVKWLVEKRCGTNEFEHERNTMIWIECCVGFGSCSFWMIACVAGETKVERGLENGWRYGRRELGMERVGKREKEGKWFEGKECLFAFGWLCFSHHLFPPFSSHHATTMLTLTHHNPQSTPSHTTCHTSMPTCCPLCVWLSVHSIHTQSNDGTPCNTPWNSLPHHPPIKTHSLSLSFHPH